VSLVDSAHTGQGLKIYPTSHRTSAFALRLLLTLGIIQTGLVLPSLNRKIHINQPGPRQVLVSRITLWQGTAQARFRVCMLPVLRDCATFPRHRNCIPVSRLRRRIPPRSAWLKQAWLCSRSFVISLLQNSSSLGMAQASLALLSLVRHFAVAEFLLARHGSSKLGSALARSSFQRTISVRHVRYTAQIITANLHKKTIFLYAVR